MLTNDLDFFEKTAESLPSDLRKTDFEFKTTNPFDIDDELRVETRKDFLKKFAKEPFEIAEERIMFGNDLMSINYLVIGLKCADKIARVHVRDKFNTSQGFGTGFMISPNLMITNNHVLESAAMAGNSLMEFNYQYDEKGNPAPTFFFRLAPGKFFVTNPDLDYTVVAVEQTAINATKKLSEFGYLRLFEDSGKALIKEYLTIIQHPNGGYKQIAIRENKLVKVEGDLVWYLTDTAPGASGSPVFNDQWQLVALHHKSIPKTNEGGQILCKDGSPWFKGMDDQLIAWEANEGIRVSAIVADLKSTNGKHALVKEILKESDTDVEISPEGNVPQAISTTTPQATPDNGYQSITSPTAQSGINTMNGGLKFTIPIEFSLQLGLPQYAAAAAGIQSTKQNGHHKQNGATATTEEPIQDDRYEIKKSKDRDYRNRRGYIANFLGTNKLVISLDELVQDIRNSLAPLTNPIQDNKHYLHYHNFSVAINKNRKLSCLTAVNINGKQLVNVKRDNTPWILDPRMASNFQTGPDVYADNDLDRGHMVRRLDPVWGANARFANDDTFHFSNSCPQDKDLNQKTWANLEDYILKNTNDEDLKVSVFTGPVFSNEDVPYRRTKLPLQFYKIAAMVTKDGRPCVTGYLLSQDVEKYRDMELFESIAETGFGAYRTYQVSLAAIQRLTKLNLDNLHEFDPMNDTNPEETVSFRPIENEQQIKFS